MIFVRIHFLKSNNFITEAIKQVALIFIRKPLALLLFMTYNEFCIMAQGLYMDFVVTIQYMK